MREGSAHDRTNGWIRIGLPAVDNDRLEANLFPGVHNSIPVAMLIVIYAVATPVEMGFFGGLHLDLSSMGHEIVSRNGEAHMSRCVGSNR